MPRHQDRPNAPRGDSAYGDDLTAPILAWANQRRWPRAYLEQSKGELFNGRDLSKKGSRRPQVGYSERIARKASEQMH